MGKLRQKTKTVLRTLLFPIKRSLFNRKAAQNRHFKWQTAQLEQFASVFPADFSNSTIVLSTWLKNQELKDKTFLNLGAATGVLALIAAGNGAKVTATDINKEAIKNIEQNAKVSNLKLKAIHSNQFKKLKNKRFDWIVTHPPFLTKTAQTESEKSWFCGEDLDFFNHFFEQLPHHMHENSQVIMVLSDAAPIKEITYLAGKNNLIMSVLSMKKFYFERIFIFMIHKTVAVE